MVSYHPCASWAGSIYAAGNESSMAVGTRLRPRVCNALVNSGNVPKARKGIWRTVRRLARDKGACTCRCRVLHKHPRANSDRRRADLNTDRCCCTKAVGCAACPCRACITAHPLVRDICRWPTPSLPACLVSLHLPIRCRRLLCAITLAPGPWPNCPHDSITFAFVRAFWR